MRHAFVDVGASVGSVWCKFAEEHWNFDIYCIEPNRALIHQIVNSGLSVSRTFVTMWAGASTFDGSIDMFESRKSTASTVLPGKIEKNGWPAINYDAPGRVPCFNFSAWLLRTFALEDDVTVKMDVEGAEYDILEKMLESRAILLVRRLICEWQPDRYPNISRARHDATLKVVAAKTKLEDWG